jgi:membrane protease YdiL (CAAX protease family)
MSFKTRLFLILFLPGLAGVLSVLLIDLSGLIAVLPAQVGSEAPTITPAIKLLSLIQPTVLVAAATLIGVLLAPKVGLSSPVAEALTRGEPAASPLRPQLLPGALGALVGALSILVTAAVFKPFLRTETIERIAQFGRLVPIPTRLLYGGITEELLLRWGFMTLVVWAAWRFFQKGIAKPTKASFIAAILISSFVFGLGHLPIAFGVLGETSVAIILFVIFANSAFGLVAGYLYWRYGLESAIIAHMLCHVLLAVASYSGAYF